MGWGAYVGRRRASGVDVDGDEEGVVTDSMDRWGETGRRTFVRTRGCVGSSFGVPCREKDASSMCCSVATSEFQLRIVCTRS